MIAFAATLVPASMIGCSSDPETNAVTDSAADTAIDDGTVDDVPSLDAAYGGPPDTAMPDTATSDSATSDGAADAPTDAASD